MKKLISVVLLLLLCMNFVSAEEGQLSQMKMKLQTLDNYIVTVNFKNDIDASITQSFDVVNRYKEPIIPGRAKLTLFKGLDAKNVVVSIGGSMKAILDEDIIEEDGNKVIYYEIWRPITRGEKLNVQVTFDARIKTQGILFKQLNLNFGEPEIKIEKMAFNLLLPSGKHVTFSEPPITLKGENSILVDIPQEYIEKFQEEPIDVEYSVLPLPTLPFHGYWLWLLMILMSAIIMALKLMNKRDMGISLPN